MKLVFILRLKLPLKLGLFLNPPSVAVGILELKMDQKVAKLAQARIQRYFLIHL